MSVGSLVRRVLGKRFHLLGEPYRAIFVDLDKVATAIAAALPPHAHCLDVGGGDGAVARLVLRKRPDVRITIVDPAGAPGSFIDAALDERVELRAGAVLADVSAGESFDAVMINDVVHHVPPASRPAFFADLADMCRRTGCRLLLIKDIQPGGWRARLALWSDLYVTADRGVVQIAADQMKAALEAAFGRDAIRSCDLATPDFPNYLLSMRLQP